MGHPGAPMGKFAFAPAPLARNGGGHSALLHLCATRMTQLSESIEHAAPCIALLKQITHLLHRHQRLTRATAVQEQAARGARHFAAAR